MEYEGVLSALDDPNKAGTRQYCGTTLENEQFMHQEDLGEMYDDLEARSLKVSVFKDSCALSNSECDPVQQLAIKDT